MKNKKAFLFLEVMVTIVIITCGLVFVTQAFSTAKNSAQRSIVLFESDLLLESRMFEFEEKGSIERDFKDGKTFPDDKDYSWSISTAIVPRDAVFDKKSDLNIVTLEVSRIKDIEKKKQYVTSYSISTYLNDEK